MKNKLLFEYQDRWRFDLNDEYYIELKHLTNDNIWPFNKLGITIQMLLKYNVYPLAGVFKNGKLLSYSRRELPIYGIFRSKESAKIYCPNIGSKVVYNIGQKSNDWVFGWEQLPESGRIVFITAGEKDTIVMNEVIGYPAISPESESSYASIPKKYIEE